MLEIKGMKDIWEKEVSGACPRDQLVPYMISPPSIFSSLRSVFDALGSVMSNKYSEGYPAARYYGGNENIDKVRLV